MKVAAGFVILIGAVIAGQFISVHAALWAGAWLAAHTYPAMATLTILIRILIWLGIVAAGFWLAVRINRP